MRPLLGGVTLALAALTFHAPPAAVARSSVPAEAQALAVAQVQAEYGPIDRVFDAKSVVEHGRVMYEVQIVGRFTVVGPMTLDGPSEPVRYRAGEIVFDGDGTVWEIGLGPRDEDQVE